MDLDILEGVESGVKSLNVVPMYTKSGPPIQFDQGAQPAPSLVIAMPILSTEASSFECLVDRPLESIGLPSRFDEPSFAQDIITSLIEGLRAMIFLPWVN